MLRPNPRGLRLPHTHFMVSHHCRLRHCSAFSLQGLGYHLGQLCRRRGNGGQGFGVIESLNESSAMAAACDEFAALQQCPSWAEKGLGYSICDELGAKVESEG